jgi:NAD-binding of NADP-dependent 3-hydroxyisobutyrate dehydrogenase
MAKRYVNCWAVHTNCPVPGPVPTSPANNDFTPGLATALMNKDLGLAMDAVSSTGSAAPLGSHAAEIYAKLAAANAALDFSAVIEMLRARQHAAAGWTSVGVPAGSRPTAVGQARRTGHESLRHPPTAGRRRRG